MAKLKKPTDHTRITQTIRYELKWWQLFAATFDGTCRCSLGESWPTLTLATDASFSGFGAVTIEAWLAGTWSQVGVIPPGFSFTWLPPPLLVPSIQNNINFLELVAVCVPLLVWGQISGIVRLLSWATIHKRFPSGVVAPQITSVLYLGANEFFTAASVIIFDCMPFMLLGLTM